jgi:hypothetical protein
MLSDEYRLLLYESLGQGDLVWLSFWEHLAELFEISEDTFPLVFAARRTWRDATALSLRRWQWFLSRAALTNDYDQSGTNWSAFLHYYRAPVFPSSSRVDKLHLLALPSMTISAFDWLVGHSHRDEANHMKSLVACLSHEALMQCGQDMIEMALDKGLIPDATLLDTCRGAMRDNQAAWVGRVLHSMFKRLRRDHDYLVIRMLAFALRTKRAVTWLNMVRAMGHTCPVLVVQAARTHYYQFTEDERDAWQDLLDHFQWPIHGRYPTCEAEVMSNMYVPAAAAAEPVIPQ